MRCNTLIKKIYKIKPTISYKLIETSSFFKIRIVMRLPVNVRIGKNFPFLGDTKISLKKVRNSGASIAKPGAQTNAYYTLDGNEALDIN